MRGEVCAGASCSLYLLQTSNNAPAKPPSHSIRGVNDFLLGANDARTNDARTDVEGKQVRTDADRDDGRGRVRGFGARNCIRAFSPRADATSAGTTGDHAVDRRDQFGAAVRQCPSRSRRRQRPRPRTRQFLDGAPAPAVEAAADAGAGPQSVDRPIARPGVAQLSPLALAEPVRCPVRPGGIGHPAGHRLAAAARVHRQRGLSERNDDRFFRQCGPGIRRLPYRDTLPPGQGRGPFRRRSHRRLPASCR